MRGPSAVRRGAARHADGGRPARAGGTAAGRSPGCTARCRSAKIQALLGARIDRLPEDERTLLTHVSVEGTPLPPRDYARAGPAGARPVVDRTLGELVRRDLIRPERAGLRRRRGVPLPSHPHPRRCLSLASQGHPLRAARALRGLAGGGARLGASANSRRSWATTSSRRVDSAPISARRRRKRLTLASRAAERLESAGRRALRRSDHRAAASLLERAVELMPADAARRTALLPDLGATLIEAGRLPDAERVLDEAVSAGRAAGEELVLSHALVQQQMLGIRRGAPSAARRRRPPGGRRAPGVPGGRR